MSSQDITKLKIIIVGEGSVGKSSLLLRYADDKFIPENYSTIGVDYKSKPITINGENVILQIWDTAGQEKFRSITKNYYNGVHGALVVFDVTAINTFNQVKYWIESIKEKDPLINIILIGNKIDLEDRSVTKEEAEKIANEYHIHYIETSAKDGTNIHETFEYISNETYQRISSGSYTSNYTLKKASESNKPCSC